MRDPVRQTLRQLLSLGVPLAVGFISQMAISFIDAALVTRVGVAELAGATLALSVFSFVMLIGLGIVTAVSPKIAESYRREEFDEVRRWHIQGVWLSIVVGLIGAGILLTTGWILRAIGQTEQLAAIAQRYNEGAAAGMIFFFLYINARGFMSAVGKPKILTWIMVSAIPLNFIIGYLFIFGIGRIPGLGVLGAGISSSVMRALIIVAIVVVVTRMQSFRALALLSGPRRISWRAIRELLKVGTPIGLRILVGEGFLPLLAFFVAGYGPNAVAAHAVGLRLEALISVFALGFSSAATTLSAWRRAEEDKRALAHLRSALLVVVLAYIGLTTLIVAGIYGFVEHAIFSINSQSVINLLNGLLPLIILAFAFDAMGSIYNGFLVGMLDTSVPTIVVTVSYWVFGVGTGFGLAKFWHLGLYGFWAGMVISSGVVAIFNYWRAGADIRGLRVTRTRLRPVEEAQFDAS